MNFYDTEHEESFNNLLVYLHNLRRTNLLTHTHIKKDLMDRFQSCFLAIRWVVHVFINCFLPVIFIGSVRLRGDYLKTMFVAVAKDGNNLTFPIAFGMTVENNLVSCTWFLMSLGQGSLVAFISNMDNVDSSCIDHVSTYSYHGYTCKSAHRYLRTRVGSGRSLETLLWITLKAYTIRDAREVLTNIGHPKWARAYVPIIHWNVLDMEVPQFFLVLSLNQCNVPVITLIKGIREYMQHTFVEQSLIADLNGHTCSCGKWRSLGITCGRAIATACHSNMHELVDMVQVFYHADVFQLVYQTQTVHPVPPPSEWEIPDPLMAVLLPM
uniref:SWIM-type domain-containing protein n=1 Tax=Lactuca sativa TaxID=4236 RepID=A0A9R1WX95_LACSA|nr:hypothetical protein LSAT_V11C800391450 [Lactuca sativa]